MKIFLTGATGFVGHHIIQALLTRGHSVRCLVRTPATQLSRLDHAETVQGDVTIPETLHNALTGCDAVIHLVGIIRPFPRKGITFERLHVNATRNIVTAAQAAGITRYLHMSALGAHADANEDYMSSKWAAEQIVRTSPLQWTIFRPALIYGSGGEFTHMLHQQVRFLPIIPIIGNGQYQLSPVAVTDIASGFANALTSKISIGKTYECCGNECCSYNELIDLFGAAIGRQRPFKLHQPLGLMRAMTRALEQFATYPVTSDQISMLIRGATCHDQSWRTDLTVPITPLAEGIKKALTG
ncbi:MAG: NAD-dependent dehydratase [Desulfuromonas sp.]|nr:MAG: NAD-dependent dehydratase [Desulfuromonas sp.]